MKEVFWDKKEIPLGECKHLKTEYYLLIDEIKIGDSFLCENYGIKVCLQGDETEEIKAIPGITTNGKQMTAFMNLLSQNMVTPSALPDVIDDWLT